MLKKPNALQKNQTIALIAPAFHFDSTLLNEGRAFLEQHYGVRTVMLDTVNERYGYLAGSDERRLEELFYWLTNPDVDALFTIRGGYGCARIYPALIKRLKRHKKLKPKILLGYSDVTILLNGLHQDLGWSTFHGPVVVGRPFREPLAIETKTISDSLFSIKPLGEIAHPETGVLMKGRAKAPIVGGCLSLVMNSLGTSYEVETDNKILFLEDVDERPYRIDRMLTQLIQAGKLDRVKGIIFGQMAFCEPPKKDPDGPKVLDAMKMALEPLLARRKIPIIYDFPAGHGDHQITFPIGVKVELIADEKKPRVVFLESGVKKTK